MNSPRKKLIEVALPLDAINRESAREKSIRHGHPSKLHLLLVEGLGDQDARGWRIWMDGWLVGCQANGYS